MKNIKHDSLDSWAESNAGRRVLHSNNVPMIIAVVLKTARRKYHNLKKKNNNILQPFKTLQSELNQSLLCRWNYKLVIFPLMLVPLPD